MAVKKIADIVPTSDTKVLDEVERKLAEVEKKLSKSAYDLKKLTDVVDASKEVLTKLEVDFDDYRLEFIYASINRTAFDSWKAAVAALDDPKATATPEEE